MSIKESSGSGQISHTLYVAPRTSRDQVTHHTIPHARKTRTSSVRHRSPSPVSVSKSSRPSEADSDRYASSSYSQMSSSSSSSNVVTSSSDVDAGDSSKSLSSNAGDSCTWYDGDACSRPRTCRDCLNVLLSSDECAVAPSGACVSMSQYESYLANRYYYTPLQRYYPSSEYSYCAVNDSVCSACSSQWAATFVSTGSAGRSTYCTGAGGCLCLADCEVQDWQETVLADECSVGGSSSEEDSGTSLATRITVSIFVGVAVAVLLAFVTWGVRRYVGRRSETRGGRMETRPRPEPTGPQLTLTGWKSLRQNLIDTEHGFVKGREEVTLQTADASFTPVEVRVEGDGVRPASPGEQHTQETANGRTAL